MFIGLIKLVALGGLVYLIWYAFRWINRLGNARLAKAKEEWREHVDPPPPGVADMRPCGVCGDYVVAGVAKACGKPRCPYP